MDTKIIFSDIDGTLLNNERQVSDYTVAQISKLKIPFVLVSARMPKQMYYIQERLGLLGSPLIAYNGALVMHDNEILHSVEMPLSVVQKIIDYNLNFAENQLHISLYHCNEWYAPAYDFWAKREENNTQTSPEILSTEKVLEKWQNEKKGVHKIMLMGDFQYIEPAFKFLNEHFGNQLHIYRAKDTYIEIAAIEISKLTGIKKLLSEKYPYSLSEAMAFGDNYNDIEMLENVGQGIAVENAHPEVKAVCKAVTKHHKEDGVALYISENIVK